MENDVLVIDDLGKDYGDKRALDGLTCSIRRGEIVGLLGPNGAGKTTTLKLLLGLLRPSRGRATMLGHDCAREARRVKELVGFCPDSPAFYMFLSGKETLELTFGIRGLPVAESLEKLAPLIARIDFEGQLEENVGGYSHGMLKKLALLLALAHEPPLLLLDEPTNGLDPPSAARVREILRERAAAGTAVLVSTHLLDQAQRMCDRLLVLRDGKLVADESVETLRGRAGEGGDLERAFLDLVR